MTDEGNPTTLGPVTVQLTGITEPATFTRLSDALAAAWRSVQALPLASLQRNWLREMLTGPEASVCLEEILRQGGGFALPFTLADSSHVVSMRAAELPSGARAIVARAPEDPVTRCGPG